MRAKLFFHFGCFNRKLNVHVANKVQGSRGRFRRSSFSSRPVHLGQGERVTAEDLFPFNFIMSLQL